MLQDPRVTARIRKEIDKHIGQGTRVRKDAFRLLVDGNRKVEVVSRAYEPSGFAQNGTELNDARVYGKGASVDACDGEPVVDDVAQMVEVSIERAQPFVGAEHAFEPLDLQPARGDGGFEFVRHDPEEIVLHALQRFAIGDRFDE